MLQVNKLLQIVWMVTNLWNKGEWHRKRKKRRECNQLILVLFIFLLWLLGNKEVLGSK